jgi:FkbM family methyltransferase
MRNAVGDGSRVILFDPHPKNQELIKKTIQKNAWENVELRSEALSDKESTAVLTE